jgi:hypothetical protein
MADWASTERLAVEVTLAEQLQFKGELHLQARSAHHDGPESPLEMLNRSDPFFPVTLQDGGIAFAAKSQVAVVVCPSDVGSTDPDRIGAAKTIELIVYLTGGSEFRGWATLELPPPRARALDYMNGPGLFFTLRNQETTRFINRTYVRLVRPLD